MTLKKRRFSRKKKEIEEEDEEIDEFPAPKSKTNRCRRQGKRGRPVRKTAELSSKDDTTSMISSSKNDEDSISQLDDENLEMEEEEMKLEGDDDAEELVVFVYNFPLLIYRMKMTKVMTILIKD